MVEKRNKRKAEEPSNGSAKQVTKKMRVPSPASSLSPLSVPSSSRSSLSHNWIHDVFPSFRGEDVRRNFYSHLQKEFQRKKITHFIDNEIKRGESIGPELIRAIRGSRIAIILISKNYASSKWCLNELVEIMKCRKQLNQIVMAIFYKVNPSNVKKLAGYFGKVFRKTCVGQTKKDIRRWRQALETVATIAGYPSSDWDNEAIMIEKIAIDVSNQLMNSMLSNNLDDLVGMRRHLKKMEELLCLKSDEVRTIGISGPSGIGKSTIARALFEEYSHEFQLSVFMENIKGCSLQNKFLSQINNQKDINTNHSGLAQDRLLDKKVLVVLDDVDGLAQLDAMAKETRWFGSGSRIIITTNNENLLMGHGINHVYKVDLPSNDEALQMFCMNAFGQKSPDEGFENLAGEVAELAGTLPIGLRVIGSSFRGMSKHEWTMSLPRLKTSLDGEIESILKFTYNALSNEDKDLFLYLACFFNNERHEKVVEHLAETFYAVRHGLQVLAEKSLISFRSGYITMHDLLVRLGKKIVREQSIYDPGQRQFLVNARETCQVLRNDTEGNINVVGIDTEYSEIRDELSRSETAFGRMSSLQLLRLHGEGIQPRSYLPQNLKYLPPKARLLHWEHFPMTSLPSNYNPEFLVELNMPNSRLENLWNGVVMIGNLKWMDLSYSVNLKELPSFSTATKLEELNIRGCLNLLELPSSIGNATNLKKLDLEDCSSLVELPFSLGYATKLEELNLNGCVNLAGLPSSIGNATNISKLYLRGCSSLVKLPSSIGSITGLKKLNLSECSSLMELPNSIGSFSKLENFYLKGCSKLESLPTAINMESLIVLDLTNCSSLKIFPETSTNIERLMLNGTAIKEVPSSIESWPRLEELHMSYCENIGEFPHAFGRITELHLSDTRIQEICPWIKEMFRLRKLILKGCTELVSLPQLPKSLAFLDAENCESLERLDSSFHHTKFVALNFVNCFKLNQEARDLIIKTPASRFALFPGDIVPTYFTYRACGSSLPMIWNGIDTQLRRSLRFKACVSLVYKGDVGVGVSNIMDVSYSIMDKQEGTNVTRRSSSYYHRSPLLKEHLYTFDVEEDVSSSELVFEFQVKDEKLEIGQCGLNLVPTLWVPV